MIVYLFKLFFKIFLKILINFIILFFKLLWLIIRSPVLIIYFIISFTNFIGRSYNRVCKNIFTYPYRLINSIRNLFKSKKRKRIEDLYRLTSKPVKIPSINFYPPDPEIPIFIETIFYLANIVLFVYFYMLIRFMMIKTKEKVSNVDWY